jgi:hypothetical protein
VEGGAGYAAFGTNTAAPMIFSTNATERMRLSSSGVMQFGGGSLDVGISRNGAGVLEVNNGTAGTLRDLTLRTLTTSGIPRFNGTNTTGAGMALLGANSPATTLTAPYTWIQVTTSDGSTGYIPVWK